MNDENIFPNFWKNCTNHEDICITTSKIKKFKVYSYKNIYSK